jgi:hypothetical protein
MLRFNQRGDFACYDFLGAPAAAQASAPVTWIASLRASWKARELKVRGHFS